MGLHLQATLLHSDSKFDERAYRRHSDSMQIRCTNCGADVPIGQSTGEVVCGYCGTQLIVGKQKGIPRLVMSEFIHLDDATLRLRRFLSNLEITTPLKVQARNVMFLPYWQLNLSANGWSDEWIAAYAPELEALHFITAVTGDTGKKTTDDIPAPSMVNAEVMLENALMLSPHLMSELDPDKPAVLVYVPFLKMQYRLAGHTFTAVIDLVAGNVYVDETPMSPQRQKSRALSAVAVLSLLTVLATVIFLPWQVLVVVLPFLLWGEYVAIMRLLSGMGW